MISAWLLIICAQVFLVLGSLNRYLASKSHQELAELVHDLAELDVLLGHQADGGELA